MSLLYQSQTGSNVSDSNLLIFRTFACLAALLVASSHRFAQNLNKNISNQGAFPLRDAVQQ